MLIHFRCRRCRNALSVAMRQAGCPMICTVCKGEIVVPSASEIAPPTMIREPAGEPGKLVPGVRGQTPVAHAPGSEAKLKKLSARRVLIAASISVLVFAAMGWTANRVWSTWRQPVMAEVVSADDADAEDTVADVDLPQPPSAVEVQPEGTAPEARLTSSLKEEEESVAGEWSQIPAKQAKAASAKSEARSTGNVIIKHRREFTEEELRKELLWAPEVGMTPKDVPPLVGLYVANEAAKQMGLADACLEPRYILGQHPELKSLPYRQGVANRLDRGAAREMQFLGQKLHLVLDALAAKGSEGRSSPVFLSEFMKQETLHDKTSTWLRPSAIPTLQQILGHEDLSVRLLLIDLLARIDGRAASLALAQHAVFDLSSTVREEAIKALDRRPREQFRSALVAALRYPWSPAADHAAEALVALHDRAATPLLVAMLKEPDPADPVVKKNQVWKREVVRLRHMDNCMTCHPMAMSPGAPTQGPVPGFLLRISSARESVTAVPTSSVPSVANRVVGEYPYAPSFTSLNVRGDITYLRQDFSIQQPVRHELSGQSVNLRFDYIVRFGPLNEKQTQVWKAQSKPTGDFEQREAILFALRELTGQDTGPRTEDWEKLYPTSEFEQWTTNLATVLVDAPDTQKRAVINKLRDAKGVAYTEALAQAIPQLAEVHQPKTRAALAERMKRMSRTTLRDKLSSDNTEIRLAAAVAVGFKEESALASDLEALLDDPEPAVAEAAQAALKALRVGEEIQKKDSVE